MPPLDILHFFFFSGGGGGGGSSKTIVLRFCIGFLAASTYGTIKQLSNIILTITVRIIITESIDVCGIQLVVYNLFPESMCFRN